MIEILKKMKNFWKMKKPKFIFIHFDCIDIKVIIYKHGQHGHAIIMILIRFPWVNSWWWTWKNDDDDDKPYEDSVEMITFTVWLRDKCYFYLFPLDSHHIYLSIFIIIIIIIPFIYISLSAYLFCLNFFSSSSPLSLSLSCIINIILWWGFNRFSQANIMLSSKTFSQIITPHWVSHLHPHLHPHLSEFYRSIRFILLKIFHFFSFIFLSLSDSHIKPI